MSYMQYARKVAVKEAVKAPRTPEHWEGMVTVGSESAFTVGGRIITCSTCGLPVRKRLRAEVGENGNKVYDECCGCTDLLELVSQETKDVAKVAMAMAGEITEGGQRTACDLDREEEESLGRMAALDEVK